MTGETTKTTNSQINYLVPVRHNECQRIGGRPNYRLERKKGHRPQIRTPRTQKRQTKASTGYGCCFIRTKNHTKTTTETELNMEGREANNRHNIIAPIAHRFGLTKENGTSRTKPYTKKIILVATKAIQALLLR